MKKILIVVDMQNDFIDGALGSHEAQAIIPYVSQKIDTYLEKGHEVYCTLDTHQENYLETSEGKSLPIPHCIEGTHGWCIHPEIGTKTDKDGNKLPYTIFLKDTFGSLDVIKTLQYEKDIESIELVGVCTDICVVANAILLKTYFPDIQIIVDAKGCAGVTPEKHRSALITLKSCQINVINFEEEFVC